METIAKRLIRDEKGAALILALIVLFVGGVIAASLLAHMGSGLLAGEVYETRTAELYAADAGVEDAAWRIPDLGLCVGQSTNYTISDVNGKSVVVFVEYVDEGIYKITSIAITADSGNTAAIDSSTTVEAYVEAMTFDLLAGALVSKSNIDFSGNCSVTGDIYYVGEITGKEYERIDGEEIQVPLSAFPTQKQNEAFADQFKEEALVGGTWVGDLKIDSNQDLGPLYITGNLVITQEVAINLTGTIYVGGNIQAWKDYTATGSGSIVAEGDIDLRKLPDYGIEGDTIIMSLNGDITFKKEATIEALVYAPNGSVNVDKKLTVEGSVIGGNINVKKDGSFTYISKGNSFEFPPVVVYAAEIKTYNVSQS